jgi:hypothetical protein
MAQAVAMLLAVSAQADGAGLSLDRALVAG